MDWGTHVTSLGSTALNERTVTFGIKDEDRLKHMCVLGRVGTGRGEFIARMAFQDIERGMGVVLLDTTGNVAPFMLERFDSDICDRLVYVDPSDAEHPYTWNPLNDIRMLPKEDQVAQCTRLIASVYQLEVDTLAKILAPILVSNKEATLVSFYTMLVDEEYRNNLYGDDEASAALVTEELKKHADDVNDFVEHGRYIAQDTLVRNILGQPHSKFSMNEVADGKIVVVNLAKIRMYPTRMTPIVRSFIETLLIAGGNHAKTTALYLHDALRYLGEDEIERAFNDRSVALTVADTVIQEADRERREKALSRCGSVVSFAIHPLDRSLIGRVFYPYVEPEELEHLEERELVVTLTVDGVRTQPFFATSMPLGRGPLSSYQDLVSTCKMRYTTPRTEVDQLFKKDGDDRPKKPGGFQDAFKAMFEKRAGAANALQTPQSAPKRDVRRPPQTKKEATNNKKDGTQSKDITKAGSGEIPEDVLKKMVYVPAV